MCIPCQIDHIPPLLLHLLVLRRLAVHKLLTVRTESLAQRARGGSIVCALCGARGALSVSTLVLLLALLLGLAPSTTARVDGQG